MSVRRDEVSPTRRTDDTGVIGSGCMSVGTAHAQNVVDEKGVTSRSIYNKSTQLQIEARRGS